MSGGGSKGSEPRPTYADAVKVLLARAQDLGQSEARFNAVMFLLVRKGIITFEEVEEMLAFMDVARLGLEMKHKEEGAGDERRGFAEEA